MKPKRDTASKHRRGFTLVELLVASAVTVVLAGLVVAMLAHMTRTWARASGGLAARQQAALALDLVARDLGSVVVRADGRAWLAATVQGDQSGSGDTGGSLADWTSPERKPPTVPGRSLRLAPRSGRLEDCRFGMAGVWLRFVAQVPDANDGVANASAPRVVAYQIVRRPVAAGAGARCRYGLFRSEVRPYADAEPARSRSTFVVGHDVFAPAYNSTAGGWNLGDAGTVRRPRRDHLLANDVIDFGVRFLRRDAATGRESVLFPVGDGNLGFAATSVAGRLTVNPEVDGAAMTYGFPTAAEVFVRVLTEEGARLVEAMEEGRSAPTDWWALAEANSIVMTRRVEMEAGR